jgi:hypothetical protein
LLWKVVVGDVFGIGFDFLIDIVDFFDILSIFINDGSISGWPELVIDNILVRDIFRLIIRIGKNTTVTFNIGISRFMILI